MKLSEEEIKHIADLANLELSTEELKKYGGQLSAILSYIDQLKEVDTSDIDSSEHASGLVNAWREDEVKNWPKDDIKLSLEQASDFEDGQIKVKKVL
jgi:aspartyl-tRNA(Asn)/glutamyl-tRNA(Gln) amidotransferase subunit C